MSDPSSTTAATKAAAKRRGAAAPAKRVEAKRAAAKRPAAAGAAQRVAATRAAAKPAAGPAKRAPAAAPAKRTPAKRTPAEGAPGKRQAAAAPARGTAAKRREQSTRERADQAVERGVVVATSSVPRPARRKLSGHLPPPSPQITLPVTGWTFMLPPRREWPWIGGVVLVAALDLIDWPVALIVAIGHTIMTNSHNEQLRELADGVEAAL